MTRRWKHVDKHLNQISWCMYSCHILEFFSSTLIILASIKKYIEIINEFEHMAAQPKFEWLEMEFCWLQDTYTSDDAENKLELSRQVGIAFDCLREASFITRRVDIVMHAIEEPSITRKL